MSSTNGTNGTGGTNGLREQLEALVSERPEVPSPAPLVIGKVRRSRRRRQAVGALAVVAAVTGGVLAGLGRTGGQSPDPAAPSPRTLCRSALPPVWAQVLEPGVFRVVSGQVIASAPDRGSVYVHDGNEIVQVDAKERRVVMTLPKGHDWLVDASAEGNWFFFALRQGQELNYTSAFVWNVPNGELRQLPVGGKRVLTAWTLGSSYLAWESATAVGQGGIEDQQREVMRLSDGATRPLPALPLFYAAGRAYFGSPGGKLRVADGWTQLPAATPPALAAAYHIDGSVGYRAVGGTFSWNAGRDSATTGPRVQDVWSANANELTEVRAPAGDFVQGVVPIGADYALAEFAVTGSDRTAETWLVDLRSHSYAKLTDDQAQVMTDQEHAIPLNSLSRLPGCS